MAQLSMHRPFDECDLHDDFRTCPVSAQSRESFRLRERCGRDFHRVQARTQFEEEPGIKAGADLAREYEVFIFEVANQQRAQANARALRIRETANHELLRSLALHLEPVRRAAMLVSRIAPFGDHTFPPLARGALPRIRI